MGDKFLNVYNFVPFSGNEKTKYNEEAGEKKYTGSIIYTITTKTPLFIPDTATYKEDEACIGHKIYDFFKYPESDNPVIPGSEIRGMVRSIYEAITNSCMGIFNAEIRPVKRTGEIFKPGLIKKSGNQYAIYKANNYLYSINNGRSEWKKEDYSEYKEGQSVYFNSSNLSGRGRNIINNINTDNRGGKGYIIKGEKGPVKKYTHIFAINNDEQNPVITYTLDELKNSMNDIINAYQEQPNSEDAYKEYYERFEMFCNGKLAEEYFPVYYSEITDNNKRFVYISPAAITKEVSNNSIGGIAKGYLPCTDVTQCCPACSLFGMAGKDNENSSASKIRFADAYLNDNETKVYCDTIILPELSSPKLGNVEFYLKKKDVNDKFWTYDYRVDKDCNIIIDGYEPTLRGRKFYLNQPSVKKDKLENKFRSTNGGNAKTKRNMTITPVREGVEFIGKMYFEDITDEQLKQLVWIMNCGKASCDAERDIVYKLGAAKPLGFGSVKLAISGIQTRTVSYDKEHRQLSYKVEPKSVDTESVDKLLESYDDVKGFDHNANATVKNSFMNLMAFEEYNDKEITYPLLQDQTEYKEGYKWFVENHKKDGRTTTGGRNKNNINRILPAAQNMIKSKLPKQIN